MQWFSPGATHETPDNLGSPPDLKILEDDINGIYVRGRW